jgi:hypothetical protein
VIRSQSTVTVHHFVEVCMLQNSMRVFCFQCAKENERSIKNDHPFWSKSLIKKGAFQQKASLLWESGVKITAQP